MVCNYNIVQHHSGSWGVISASGLFYPDEIFVEVKHCGIMLGEYTLDEIIEGFKKSPKGEEKKYTPGLCGSINKRMDNQEKEINQLKEDLNKVLPPLDNIEALERKIKELEDQINKVNEYRKEDWKYTQEKTSFHHSELIRLNALMTRNVSKYENYVHSMSSPHAIINNYTCKPKVCDGGTAWY